MSGTMAQIRAALGLAPKVAGIDGLTCYTFTPDAVAAPCWYPGEVTISRRGPDSHRTFGKPSQGGQRGYEIQCTVLTSRSDDQAGQALLDRYLSEGDPWSLVDAVEADVTLGGLCNTLIVHDIDGYRLYTVGSDVYYGARLRVLVLA